MSKKPKNTALRRYLYERRITATQVSNLTGISYPSINHYINGTRTPPVDRAQLIAEKLGVDLETIFPMQNTEEPHEHA